MEKLSKEQKKKIIDALEKRGATLPCPRCGHKDFTVLDGYIVQTIQTDVIGMILGGASIPSAVVACVNCGFISQHALGALELLPEKRGEK